MDDEEHKETALNGTFQVRLGDSLLDNETLFYSFRYNFAPDSIDKSKGSLTIDSSGESTLTFTSSTPGKEGEGENEHQFIGPQVASKENDYLLIFDSDTNEFILEKNSSTFQFKSIRPKKRNLPEPITEEPSSQTKGNIILPNASLVTAASFTASSLATATTAVAATTTTAIADSDEEDNFSDLEISLLQDLEGEDSLKR